MGLTRGMLRVINEVLVAPMRWRVASMVRRAVVKSVSSAGGATTATVKPMDGPAGEVHEEVEVIEHYGFTSVPPDGSETVLLCPGGDTGHPIVLAVGDSRVRLVGLGAGEVAMYYGEGAGGGTGSRIVLRNTGSIEIQAGVGGVVTVSPSGSVDSVLPVARETDPIALNSSDVTSINALVGAWNALATGAGGPLIVPPSPALAVVTGEGTIVEGGKGIEST